MAKTVKKSNVKKAGVEISSRRVYAWSWMCTLTGEVKYEHFHLSYGHKITEILLSPPNKSHSKSDKHTYTLGGNKVEVIEMLRSAVQVNIRNIPIHGADDFDVLFPSFHHKWPVLTSKGIIVRQLVTVKNGKTFVWRRKNVSAVGTAVHRMVLVSINGKDTKVIPEITQRKLAGSIVENVCEFRKKTEEPEYCKFSFED